MLAPRGNVLLKMDGGTATLCFSAAVDSTTGHCSALQCCVVTSGAAVLCGEVQWCEVQCSAEKFILEKCGLFQFCTVQ